jgi:hypothetical protein
MAIFDRFRKPARTSNASAVPAVGPRPEINQRVTVRLGAGTPAPSRVDDESANGLVLSLPSLPLEVGDRVEVAWESESGWFHLDTEVREIEEGGNLPTVTVAREGALSRHADRRGSTRASIQLPIEVRVITSRAVKPGQVLATTTREIGTEAISFATSAPFAPGDVLEALLTLPAGDVASMRLRLIRVDAIASAWKQTGTAVMDDSLRSDRTRIATLLDGAVAAASAEVVAEPLQAPSRDELRRA